MIPPSRVALCAALTAAAAVHAQPDPADTTVVVASGQTLLGIAIDLLEDSQYYTVSELAAHIRARNGMTSDRLAIGQSLRVPLRDRAADPARTRHDRPVRGLYATAHVAGSTRVLALVDSLVAAGGNAVVFDVKDVQGDLSYVSAVPLARRTQVCDLAAIDRPQALVQQLHRRDLHVIARLTCFCDARLVAARPDLAPRAPGGGPWGREWLDPANAEVQQYLLELVDEISAFGVDEIQLDYVRFPTDEGAAQAAFAVPDSLSRHEVITAFVRRVRDRLDGTGVRLSADVFGVVAWGRWIDVERTGQYLPDLVPLLDVACPMLYPSHFYGSFLGVDNPADYPYFLVHEGVRRLLPLARAHGVAVRPWIQAFPYRVSTFDADYVTEQMRAAEDAGADGWLLWHPASRYDVGLRAVRQDAEGTAHPSRQRTPPQLGARRDAARAM